MGRSKNLFRIFAVGTTIACGASALVLACTDDPAPLSGRSSGTKTPGSGADGGSNTPGSTPPAEQLLKAHADITAIADGGTITGKVTFEEVSDGTVTMVADLKNVPDGDHGFHIHVNANCGYDPDGGAGALAGGHWNPTDAGHAFPDSPTHHAGDMGNLIVIGGNGLGAKTVSSDMWTVKAGPKSVLNHAIVVHANPDDGHTAPSGNSGPRTACGLIVQD